MFMKNIAENIELKRKQLNMTQDELCARCHLSKPNYHVKLKNPGEFRLRELKRIADVLNFPLKKLIFSEIVFFEK